MSHELASSLIFVCEVCGRHEEPNDELSNKIEQELANISDFPFHCGESMRLTIREQIKSEDTPVKINTESVRWIMYQTLELFATKTLEQPEIGNQFEEEFEKAIAELPQEGSINLLYRYKEIVSSVVDNFNTDKDVHEKLMVLLFRIIDNAILRTLNRAKRKIPRNEGPVLPGSDPSFDLEFFCQICGELVPVDEDTKQQVLMDDDSSLPIHHDVEVGVRIISDKRISPRSQHSPTTTSDWWDETSNSIKRMRVRSIGIDIGSSTSHLIISTLSLKQEVGFMNMTNRFLVEQRQVDYFGKIIDTPLFDKTTIDVKSVIEYCSQEIAAAGIEPHEIDTGAVIVTGETAKKSNAEEIVTKIASESGKFVSAAAGPNFESFLAAMGCGAVQRSELSQNTILSVDIGGGTSNMAISHHGKVMSTACINVGGRLLGIDHTDGNGQVFRIWRVDDPAFKIMKHLGISKKVGDLIGKSQVVQISKLLVQVLVEVMTGTTTSQMARELMMTDDLDFSLPVDEIIFSGGIAELYYHDPWKDSADTRDIGPFIAQELLSHQFEKPIIEPKNKIRATVIGAGSYSLSVSGSTCYYTEDIKLPLTNIPVLLVNVNPAKLSAAYIEERIGQAYAKFDYSGDELVALYFDDPIYHADRYIPEFVRGLEQALLPVHDRGLPIILLFGADIGSLIGIYMKDNSLISNNFMCIDELILKDGDWVDIGKPLKDRHSFPVTVKSLVFNS